MLMGSASVCIVCLWPLEVTHNNCVICEERLIDLLMTLLMCLCVGVASHITPSYSKCLPFYSVRLYTVAIAMGVLTLFPWLQVYLPIHRPCKQLLAIIAMYEFSITCL